MTAEVLSNDHPLKIKVCEMLKTVFNNDREKILDAFSAGAVSCCICDDDSLLMSIDCRADATTVYVSAKGDEPLRIWTQPGAH